MFESFGLRFYVRLCCVNYALEVQRGQRCSVFACHVVDGLDAISQSVHHVVHVCDGGISDAFVLELHSVGWAFALCVFNMAIVCAIVFG